jgi:CBS domain-containing protein
MICPTCDYDNLPGSELCWNCQNDLTQLDRPAAQDRVERSLMNDQVLALQPKRPVTISPTASVGQAMGVMLASNIGAAPVVDDAGRLVGIFSERDLMNRAIEPGYAERLVKDLMTTNPVTVRESDPLAFALHKMDSGGYRHLPVLRDGNLVGMISVRDMLRHITRLCHGR